MIELIIYDESLFSQKAESLKEIMSSLDIKQCIDEKSNKIY